MRGGSLDMSEEIRKFICVSCPLGCGLSVTLDGQGEVTNVEGNSCPRGKAYAESEVKDPRRVFASTVRVSGGKLPVCPPWFDKEQFTDKSMRFFASEIIREKILENYDKEIPYCTEVVVERFKEGDERYDIGAVINVMRDSQKGILIGKGGSALKRVATQARLEMEDFFQKKVFLQVFVKVEPDWRENKKMLRKFGYIQD